MADYPWPNLVSMFFSQADVNPEKPFLWAKRDGQYQSLSWKQVAERVEAFASALTSLGVKPGDRVVLVSENRPLWAIADLAVMAAGAITVPAYTTNTEADHLHILKDSGAVGAIVSSRKLADKLIPAMEDLPDCRFLIARDDLGDLKTTKDTHRYADIVGPKSGFDIRSKVADISPDQTACLIYTSGTGGKPKGVILSHRSILHNVTGAIEALEDLGVSENETEIFLSFLPLSHSYEHTAGLYFPIVIRAEIYYAEGIEHLVTNMSEACPTIMTAVPRLYESMRTRIERGVISAGGLKAKLFLKALEIGRKRYEDPTTLTLLDKLIDPLLDKLVRAKVKARFGGRLKALVSGGAPLNYDVGLYFTALGLTILQGYGQTEAAPLISVNRKSSLKLHSVGAPVKNTELKIAEDGEICVKGDLVMQGYWGDEEATKSTIVDGWLHTGDVGHLDNEGHIVITDRKKDIIVNSGGDNVSPQRVEGILALEPEIHQIMVYGDKRPHLVAVVVPDPDWLKDWARSSGKPLHLADLKDDPDLAKALKSAVDRSNASLSTIEKVRKLIVADSAFTIDNEQLTPTLKVRRHVVKSAYGTSLEALYR